MINRLAEEVIQGKKVSKSEAMDLVSGKHTTEALITEAGKIKKSLCGDGVYRCAIVNAKSGECSENCAFCAQSVHHDTKADIYPFIKYEELLRETLEMKNKGVNCFGVVTSGESPGDDEIEKVARLCRDCRSRGVTGIGASLGILSFEKLSYLKESGLIHYNHNLETSKNYYPNICTTHSWQQRFDTVKAALNAGLEVCSGGIFGLGETFEDRVDMGLSLRELRVKNVPLNFLSPIKGTPLENNQVLTAEEALRIIAVYRFIFPDGVLRICGGRQERLSSQGNNIFKAGATGILTGDYLTTKGSSFENDLRLIQEAGLYPAETEEDPE